MQGAPYPPRRGVATNDIELLGRASLERATITLERAFSTDPMFAWIFPDAQRRCQSLRVLNRVPLEYGLRHGRVTHSNEALATAIWIPPGHTITPSGMIRSGILGVPGRIGFRPFVRFMGANSVMGRLHKKYVPEPHWYLLIVGVDPELQGRGLGTALVTEGLARADQSACPCYLETSQERNLAFYERHGFAIVASAPLGKGGPTGWAMRRDAQEVG